VVEEGPIAGTSRISELVPKNKTDERKDDDLSDFGRVDETTEDELGEKIFAHKAVMYR
jgi:hypothetical protein